MLKKKLINKLYKILSNENSMLDALKRSSNRNIVPATVIDVGAAQGLWSMKAKKVWKDAEFLLFEPLSERKMQLQELSKKLRISIL